MSEYGILMLQLPIESITREMYFDQVVRKDSYLGKHPSTSTQLASLLYILDAHRDVIWAPARAADDIQSRASRRGKF